MSTTSLNLAHYHFKRVSNGMTVIGTWLHTTEKTVNCLVLIREGEELHEATVPCIIPESEAWVFCGINGVADPHRAIPAAIEFARMMRMPLEKPVIYKIIRTIEDHVGDLVSIPPYLPPLKDIPVIADAIIRNRDTGEIEEMEIHDVRS